jgi:carboxyl-terminal processing protease
MHLAGRRLQVTAAWVTCAAVALASLVGVVRPQSARGQSDTAPATTTTPPVTPAQYVAIALDFIEARAYKRPTVDWPSIRTRAEQLAATAPTLADTYPIIAETVKALNDKHSSFTRPPEAVRQTAGRYNGFGFLAVWPTRQVVTVADASPAARAGLRIGDRIDKVDGKAPKATAGVITIPRDRNGQFPPAVTLTWTRKGVKKPITKTLAVGEVTLVSVPKAATIPSANGQSFGRIGYLEIPGIVGDDAAQRNYATQVQAAMRELETSQARCGWVIDLRRNRGGYIYAMLAGLGPLLDGGTPGAQLGGQRGVNGEQFLWHYLDGATVVNTTRTVGVDAPYALPRSDVPVAVLTSQLTASAGEATTIAFRGRPSTRSFGEATDGLTTFNERKNMPDGAFLDIMSAVDIDRLGNAYEGPVPPDQAVIIDWANVANERDPVLVAASTWLTSQVACTSS